MVRVALVLIAVSQLLDGSVRAQSEDPDTEVARRHYQGGSALYDAGRYEEAIAEFEEARKAKPKPAFDYNIARCYDRMGRWAPAIDAYERYLRSGSEDAAAVRERIAELKARLAPVSERARRKHIAGWALGGAGLALIAVGGGLLALRASTVSALQRLNDARMPFDPSLEARVDATEISSGVLFGVGGAAVLTGVVLVAVKRRF